jgi:hypothetical protein
MHKGRLMVGSPGTYLREIVPPDLKQNERIELGKISPLTHER